MTFWFFINLYVLISDTTDSTGELDLTGIRDEELDHVSIRTLYILQYNHGSKLINKIEDFQISAPI